MIEKVREFIFKENLIKSGDRLLVAVSGGIDSVVLLYIMYSLKRDLNISLGVVHFYHKVRIYGCKTDFFFVKKMAENFTLPFIFGAGDVPAMAKKHGKSLEEAGREARYDFFYSLIDKSDWNKIALAHTASDQVETFFMRLIRGSGLNGLAGMSGAREEKFIRPLLSVWREELEDYAGKNDLFYREDQTNKDCYFFRNKVRNKLIPYLEKEFNPRLSEGIYRLTDILKEENNFLNNLTEDLLKELLISQENDKVILNTDKLLNCHKALRRRLIRFVLNKFIHNFSDINYEKIDKILELMDGETGKLFKFSHITIRKSYNTLVISEDNEKEEWREYEKLLSFPGETVSTFFGIKIIIKFGRGDEVIRGNNFIGLFDKKKLLPPISLRTRKRGDRFTPSGMKGKKKIKDFFIDKKIPLVERDKIPIICSGGKIAWVGGLRIDEYFKVTSETEEIVTIQIEELKKNGEE